MFDIGWTEMLVIAVVMIVVVGPKDLPRMLRTFGKTTAKLRSMAGDFQKQFNDALKEAELDDVKKSVDALRGLNPTAEIKKHLNPFEKAAADVRTGVEQAMKPKPSTAAEPALPETHPAEPAKSGATAMPGVAGPEAMPVAPLFPAMTDSSPNAVAAAPAKASKSAAKAAAKAAAAKPVAKPAVAKPAAVTKTVASPGKIASVPIAKPVAGAAPAKPAAQKTAAKTVSVAAKKPAPAKTAAKKSGTDL